jgi:hypothetical protein
MGQEEHQQVELARGKNKLVAAPADPVRRQVHLQIGAAEHHGHRPVRVRSSAAQHRLDAQHQLARAERLGDVVVRA